MEEVKFYWNKYAIYHSESHFLRELNILNDNMKKIIDLKNNLNSYLKGVSLNPFTGLILLFKSDKNNISGFASPFLNSINISGFLLEKKKNEGLLWLILHEYMHILEAEILSEINIQDNSKLKFFNDIVNQWLNKSLDLEIEISKETLDIVNNYVYNYNDIAIDWEKNSGYIFSDKFGEVNYDIQDLMQIYVNLLKENGSISKIPDNDIGLEFLLENYIEYINYWSIELSKGELMSTEGRIISNYLLNWTLYKLYLELIRNARDPYSILSDARAIYFSSIIIDKNIDNYQKTFPIDDCKIFEAKRLQEKYGNEFSLRNFKRTIKNELLSDEAKNMAFRSSVGL